MDQNNSLDLGRSVGAQFDKFVGSLPADYPFPDLFTILPELILAVGAMALLIYGVYRRKDPTRSVSWLAVGLLGLTAIAVLFPIKSATAAFHGAFMADGFARFVKMLIVIGSAAAIIISQDFIRKERIARFEYPILILLSSVGMMTMASANDLIMFYIGVELQSLPLYVLAAFNRDSQRSTEAGLKYFVLGALSSGLLLYGCSLIYGFAGTTTFPQIAAIIRADGGNLGLTFGLAFLTASLAFKVSAVPFHMWTPDVYEGAPTPVTAFFGMAPKMAALALFARAMLTPFGGVAYLWQWQQILVFISVASMVLGAFAAIGQTNIKRLMAYSTIGHMGFALVGLAAGTVEGVKGLLIYISIYLAMTIGTFICILSMRRREGMVETIADLSGLSRTHPMMAAALALLMFSLAGVPPLAGFFGKWFVFAAAVQAKLYWLAVVGVVTSVVGAYYYLRIVKIMYFDEPAPAFERPMPRDMGILLGATSLFILFFGIFPGPLVTAARAAATVLFP